jgi:hypothetical protein
MYVLKKNPMWLLYSLTILAMESLVLMEVALSEELPPREWINWLLKDSGLLTLMWKFSALLPDQH